jgi:anthranilate synthase component 1
MFRPTPEEANRLLQQGGRVYVWHEMLADFETPTSAYWKLSHDSSESFLLESVTGGESLARYSFIGTEPDFTLISRANDYLKEKAGAEETGQIPRSKTPLDLLKSELGDLQPIGLEGMPRFCGGAVGFLSYDLVRHFERIPDKNRDELKVPDMLMSVYKTVVAFDHAKNRIVVISQAGGEISYTDACTRINEVLEKLRRPMPKLPDSPQVEARFSAGMSRDAYEAAVAKTIEYIRAGDGVQMVISQRFSALTLSHPINIYRALRFVNPSPYMYLLRTRECDVIGASPEVLVTVEGRTARVRPIAGTRPRADTQSEDERLEKELLADEKERAEHIMLVDLGRNDIGRIAKPGTVQVDDLMCVERYSHVMHIVSNVTGEIKDGLDAFDVLRACFPAGTVSGAPKVRAMEIIDELEPTRRGLYAGAVGYIGFDGDMDMAIAIRTILLKDGVATVQAGAGIVFDSVPAKEWQECHSKAAAVIKAVEMAEAGAL